MADPGSLSSPLASQLTDGASLFVLERLAGLERRKLRLHACRKHVLSPMRRLTAISPRGRGRSEPVALRYAAKRCLARARAFAASTSRFLGGAVVTSSSSR